MVVFLLLLCSLVPTAHHCFADQTLEIPPAPLVAQEAVPLIQSVDHAPRIEIALDRINPERINTLQKQIARDMMINKWTRYTLRGASAALMVSAGYVLLKWMVSSPAKTVDAITVTADSVKTVAVEKAPDFVDKKAFDALTRRVHQIESQLNPSSTSFFTLSYWYRGLMHARDYGIYLILAPLAVSRTNAAVDRVFINRDIDWFVIQKTTLIGQLEAFKRATQSYADEQAPGYQHDFYISLFPDLCARMVKQIEAVIAFMTYTYETLPPAATRLGEINLQIGYLSNCTNDMSTAVEQFLNDKNLSKDKHQLELIITRFSTEVNNTIHRFKDAVQDILNSEVC